MRLSAKDRVRVDRVIDRLMPNEEAVVIGKDPFDGAKRYVLLYIDVTYSTREVRPFPGRLPYTWDGKERDKDGRRIFRRVT